MPASTQIASIDKADLMEQIEPLLANGVPTEEIVKTLNLPITGRTLRNWITADDNAPKARTAFFNNKLIECAEGIDNARGNLPLARARESYRAWAHLAAARDSANFGAKQQIEHTGTVSIDFSQRLRQAERIIEGDAVLQLPHSNTVHNEVEDAQVVDSNEE